MRFSLKSGDCPCHTRNSPAIVAHEGARGCSRTFAIAGVRRRSGLQRAVTASVAVSKIDPAVRTSVPTAQPRRRQAERSGFSAGHRPEKPLPIRAAGNRFSEPGAAGAPLKSAARVRQAETTRPDAGTIANREPRIEAACQGTPARSAQAGGENAPTTRRSLRAVDVRG